MNIVISFSWLYTLSYHPKQSTSFNIFLNIGSLIGTTNLNLLPLIWYLHRLFMDHHHSFSQFKKWVIKWNHQQFERFPDSVKKILRNFLIHCQCTYVKAFMSGFTILPTTKTKSLKQCSTQLHTSIYFCMKVPMCMYINSVLLSKSWISTYLCIWHHAWYSRWNIIETTLIKSICLPFLYLRLYTRFLCLVGTISLWKFLQVKWVKFGYFRSFLFTSPLLCRSFF